MTTLQEAQPIIELLESSDTEMLPSTSEGAGLRRQDGVVYANGSPSTYSIHLCNGLRCNLLLRRRGASSAGTPEEALFHV